MFSRHSILFLVGLIFILYWRGYSSIPVTDTIRTLILLEHNDLLTALFKPRDVHIYTTYRLFTLIIYSVGGFHSLLLFLSSLLLHISITLALWFWLEGKLAPRLQLLITAMHASSIIASSILFWQINAGMQMAFLFTLLGIMSAERLKTDGGKRRGALAFTFCLLANLSFAFGYITPFLVFGFLVFLHRKPADWIRFSWILIALLPAALLVLFNYQSVNKSSVNIANIPRFIVISFSNGMFYQLPFVKYAFPEWLCWIIFIVFFSIVFHSTRNMKHELKVYSYLISGYIFSHYLMVAIGRSFQLYYGLRHQYHYSIYPFTLFLLFLGLTHLFPLEKFLRKKHFFYAVLTILILINASGTELCYQKYWGPCFRVAHKEYQTLDSLVDQVKRRLKTDPSKIDLPDIRASHIFAGAKLEKLLPVLGFREMTGEKINYINVAQINKEHLNDPLFQEFLKYESNQEYKTYYFFDGQNKQTTAVHP